MLVFSMTKLKSKLLTKLFLEWVETENDTETLEVSKKLIQKRQNRILGCEDVKQIGFRY